MGGQQEGNLSDTFGAPALSGLLRRRTPGPLDPAPATPPDSKPASTPDRSTDQQSDSKTNSSTDSGSAVPAQKAAAQNKSAAAARPARTGPSAALAPDNDGDSEVTSQVSIYLLPEAIQAARRTRGRRTNAELAWEAIDATHQRLAELLATRHGGTPRPGSLFPARQAGRTVATGDARRALWSIKATPAELAVVDRLVAELGAASRSELIATAVEAHLGSRRRSTR